VPYVVHGVKLHAFALVPLSEDKKIYQEVMNFIMIALLDVDGVTVDAVEDVIGWKEVIGTPATRSLGDVELNHLSLGHWLVKNMNTEHIGGVWWNRVSKALVKFLPRGTHNILLGHPSEGAKLILVLLKVDRGVELANDLIVEGEVEVHPLHNAKLLTNTLGFPKVLKIVIHLLQVGLPLGATSEVLYLVDLIKDPLLVL
jgi:hypothetical protein